MDAKLKKFLEEYAADENATRFEGKRLVVVDEDCPAEADGESLGFEVAMRVEGWADTVSLTVWITEDGEVSVDETAIGPHHLDDKFPSPMPFDWPNETDEP